MCTQPLSCVYIQTRCVNNHFACVYIHTRCIHINFTYEYIQTRYVDNPNACLLTRCVHIHTSCVYIHTRCLHNHITSEALSSLEVLGRTVVKPHGCLEKNSLGGPEGNQTVLRGSAPKNSLITPGTSRMKFFQTYLRLFHC